MDERIGQTVTVDGAAYRILRLLGKGKGGLFLPGRGPRRGAGDGQADPP